MAGEYGDGGEVVVVANGTARKGVRFCPRPGFVGGWIYGAGILLKPFSKSQNSRLFAAQTAGF